MNDWMRRAGGRYHDAFRNALIKDGWTITHDPFDLEWDDKELYVNVEEERLVAAQKQRQKIAVEIIKFLQPLPDNELEHSIDLFAVYRAVLAEQEPDYVLYLALPEEVYKDVFQDVDSRLILEEGVKRVISFDPAREEIIQWIT